MEKYNEDQLLRQLARQYADHYGELLMEENAALERQGILRITPRMDKKIGRLGKTGNARRYAGGLSALAAAFLLIILIPRLMDLNNRGITASNAPSAAATADAEQAAPAEAPSASEAAPQLELLPLTFALPENFSVADSKLDNGKSVYYLKNSDLDDVVMTMELDSVEDIFSSLKPIEINGYTAYYKYTHDFSVMAFEKSDVTYVLTCKYDVNTLVPLAEAIL